MYSVGVFPGKFFPPHRGHLAAILNARTRCKKLYVVVSCNEAYEATLAKSESLKPISIAERVRWLSIETKGIDNIVVIGMNEENVPASPNGWAEWTALLNKTIPEKFDAIFGSDIEYATNGYTKYFPEVKYEICDQNRELFPISATEIRKHPFENWDYILGSARGYFAKKVLITGTESCGKTTLTTMLAKIFHTSWTEEEGRYYSTRYMGGNETTFHRDDFFNICCQQRSVENAAIKGANKVVFFDTDAIITQYYCEMYLGEKDERIESFVDVDRYDIVLFLTPDIPWVPDGFRWNSDDQIRSVLNDSLMQMYVERGFKDKIIVVSGNYEERLQTAIKIGRGIIGGTIA